MNKRFGKIQVATLVAGIIIGAFLILAASKGKQAGQTTRTESNLVAGRHQNMIEPLVPYVNQVLTELDKVSDERRFVLDIIAKEITVRLSHGSDAKLTFICTHNSRRSHMSQVWAQTAAYYFGLDKVSSFSGGIEATAFNIRTVAGLRKAGFSIVATTQQENPVYLIQFANDRAPTPAYSKAYNSGDNPKEDFVALMCCSEADKTCPVVEGATSRFAIHYIDPKASDDTEEETSVYDARCREIAREMFYIMSHVKKI
ncbi:MAG: protein-tyrosine-phosphatase [Planctomycetes bacterium]|nr:protein-tyrosine-phosphatase [Planctomycetota bacterium]